MPLKSQEKKCHDIEPNPSKDRAMHEGDNSFKDNNRIQFRERVNMNVKPLKRYLV
jgi:hypothetical protein